jgi:hypothetical protein
MWSTDDNEDFNQKKESEIQLKNGPYQVDFMKPYKPIFICYIDLLITIITFFIVMIYDWNNIKINKNTYEDFDNVISQDQILGILFLLFRFILDILYLKIFTKQNELNKS